MQAASQKSRLLTAAVGVPVIVIVVALGGWPLWVLLAVGSVFGQEEYYAMAGRPVTWLRLAGQGLGLAAIAAAAAGGYGWTLAVVLAALWLEQFDFLGRYAGRGDTDARRGVLLGAVLYVSTTLAFFCRFSPLETYFVLAVVFAADTGAYYGGHLLGGPKVWPAVSPGKTVSGSLCGLVSGIVIGALCGLLRAPGPLALAGLGGVLAVVSQFGDFFESALKRAVGVKDSGRILPGHGGMLDRIDGLLPAVLAYAACRAAWGFAG
jgi:phosphatidate cytidylyltransferase